MTTINEVNVEDEESQINVNISLEQWKIYVQMADNTSERRIKNNAFFLTVNTALISVCGTNLIGNNKKLIFIVGILISVAWIFSIRSYKLLNSAKFKVINNLETRLQVQGFTKEWEELKKKKGFKLTTNEYFVPIIFIGIYILCLWSTGACKIL